MQMEKISTADVPAGGGHHAEAKADDDGEGVHAQREFHLSGESEKLQRAIWNLLSKETPDKRLVIVQFFINRIFKVDDVDQSIHIDLYLKLNWHSEAWVGKTDDDFQADETHLEKDWWRPGVEVTNAIELNKETEEEEAYWLEFPKYGILAYTQRYIGTIHAEMDLHRFPFDHQNIPITFESFHWKESDMNLLRLPSVAKQRPPEPGGSWLSVSNDVDLPEWTIEAIDVDEKVKHYAFEDRKYSQVYVNVRLRRKWAYYIYKVISILIMIVLMSLSTCAMDPNELPDRTGVVVTLFLAAVAFNFVIGTQLPKISYNTRLDEYLLVTYVIITVSVLENVLSYQFYDRIPDHDLAIHFDKWSAVAIGSFFFLYNVYWFADVIIHEISARIKPEPASPLSTSLSSGSPTLDT